MVRRSALVLILGLGSFWACARSEPRSRQLDVGAIEVVDNAKLRTDTVGEGKFASESTFVLVDAANPTPDGAYVTLAGQLKDEGGAVIGQLNPQSLWIPSGQRRTFALVDTERVPRPTTTSARIVVAGALVPADPPRVHVTELHEFLDNGRIVAQAYVVNETDRIGKAIVIAAFHGPNDVPMTRPFQVLEIPAKQKQAVQFVGPAGSTKGTIFIGDVVF